MDTILCVIAGLLLIAFLAWSIYLGCSICVSENREERERYKKLLKNRLDEKFKKTFN